MSRDDPAPSAPPASREGGILAQQIRALAVLALLAFAAAMAIAWSQPPAPIPATAPPTQFSAARALQQLAVVAQRPHPAGSIADDEVRRYLVSELAALGLTAEVQESIVVQTRYANPAQGWPAIVGRVKNVVARARGTEGGDGTKALLLSAHYDSVAMAPGASDDGVGVVTLLETARALRAQGPTKHDVIFLFTEGEEEGLLGARAFVREHRWAKDVAMVLNFEARGDRGPVFMFQASPDNGALVRELAAAAPNAMASSLTGEIYKRMPNDTDFTEWLAAGGVQGLNFANIAGFDRYHAPTDDVTNLDRGTLQQHGDYAVALARRFADGDLSPPREPDATYFNLGPLFVHYPGAWASPLAGLALALALAFTTLVLRRGHARFRGIAVGATLGLLPVVATAVAAYPLWNVLAAVHADYALFPATSPAPERLYLIGFSALAATVSFLAYAFLLRRVRIAELSAGTAILWALFGAVAAWKLPAASYLLTWPLLLAIVPWTIAAATKRGLEDARVPMVVLHAAAALAPLVLLFPMANVAVMVRGASMMPAVAVIVAVAMAFMLPAVYYVLLAGRGAGPLLGLATMVLATIGGAATPSFDTADPRPDTLLFAVDADEGKGFWVTTDAAADAYTGKVLGGALTSPLPQFLLLRPERPLVHRETKPPESAAPARLDVVSDEAQASGARHLVVRVTPPARSNLVAVFIHPAAQLTGATVEGQSVPLLSGSGLAFYRYGEAAPEGFVVALDVAKAAPFKVRVVASSPGFPTDVQGAPGARPPELMARSGTLPPYDDLLDSDRTIVLRTYEP